MRILFATTHAFLPQYVGGSERSTHDLCRVLSARGETVAVLSGLIAGDLCWVWNRLRSKLLPNNAFPTDRLQGYTVFRGWDVMGAGASEASRKYAPDVVLIQAGEALNLARVFDELRVPTLVYLRDAESLEPPDGIRLDRIGFVANSGFVAAKARERLGVEATVIPPLINYEAFDGHRTRRMVTLINPHPVKGGYVALALARARPDIPFEFIESWRGERALAPLRAEAAKLPNVRWRSPILDPKRLYENTKVLIVPSQWDEPWGRVVNEAQACGIPVIASNVGGLPESVGKGGLLVSPADDHDVWLRTLSALWDDPSAYSRLSEAALANVRRPELQPDGLVARLLDSIAAVRSNAGRNATTGSQAP